MRCFVTKAFFHTVEKDLVRPPQFSSSLEGDIIVFNLE